MEVSAAERMGLVDVEVAQLELEDVQEVQLELEDVQEVQLGLEVEQVEVLLENALDDE